jgi:hypothetical protein
MYEEYYGLIPMIGIFSILFIIFICCFCLNYVYCKHHVFIEKQIATLFVKKLNASRFICACKQKHACKQCRIWFGVYYIFRHPYRLTSYFKFENSQDTQKLLDTIAQAFKLDKFVVESDPKHHNSLLLKKSNYRVRISLRPLLNVENFHTQYRLICTWIPN